jgi:hypothetical protein
MLSSAVEVVTGSAQVLVCGWVYVMGFAWARRSRCYIYPLMLSLNMNALCTCYCSILGRVRDHGVI